MLIEYITAGGRKGYRTSYNHNGVQVVEFAPTRLEAIKAVFHFISTFLTNK